MAAVGVHRAKDGLLSDDDILWLGLAADEGADLVAEEGMFGHGRDRVGGGGEANKHVPATLPAAGVRAMGRAPDVCCLRGRTVAGRTPDY